MTEDRAARAGRCPDGGYCHGLTLAAGSPPCPEGTCLRVRTSGPLSGVFPGDRWPDHVRRANGLDVPRRAVTDEHLAAARLAVEHGHPSFSLVEAVSIAIHDAEERGRDRGVRPFRELFAGGPDTSCRTTYREGSIPECSAASIDCVEVPLDDLRAAFVEAGDPA